jgi:glucosyl-3-phosphoglycerate synthase
METPPLTAERWARERTLAHATFPPERLAAERTATASVILPARECAATVGPIVAALAALRRCGAIDEVIVVDARSRDGTARIAAAAGAAVYQESELLGELGPAQGKGDAMWRALSVAEGEVVCYLDADIDNFSAHFACGVLGPLLCPGAPRAELVQFVKGSYRRPFRYDGVALPDGGGRVNHLMARPLLAMFYPELAGVRQPLAGEVAARRELLERLPFSTGYAVETAMLIDVWREVGLEGMVQVDLGVRHNRHQPLEALSHMAYEVLLAVCRRLEAEGRLHEAAPQPLLALDGAREVVLRERPPMVGRSVRAA